MFISHVCVFVQYQPKHSPSDNGNNMLFVLPTVTTAIADEGVLYDNH